MQFGKLSLNKEKSQSQIKSLYHVERPKTKGEYFFVRKPDDSLWIFYIL